MSDNRPAIHLVGVPFDDTILVALPFNGTVAAGKDVIKSIGGIGNMMAQVDFEAFAYHIFHVAPKSPALPAIDQLIKAQHPKLNITLHASKGEQPSAYVIEAQGASSRQSVVFGRFDETKKLSFPAGSIIHLCYLENTPCLVGDTASSLFIGDFNNAMNCAPAIAHNTPLLDVLLLSLDENSVFKNKIGFDKLKEGCFVIAHEPQRIVLSRMEGGRSIELARLENQHYLPQASNLTGNGDVFSGYVLTSLRDHYDGKTRPTEATLTRAIRFAQEKTAGWLENRMHAARG